MCAEAPNLKLCKAKSAIVHNKEELNSLSANTMVHGIPADSPFWLVGVSASDMKLPKLVRFMLGEKSSLIWMRGGSVEIVDLARDF